MATSEAQICNKALARIGVKNFIDDLNADQSQEAEIARMFYDDERDSLLMQAPWPFATRRASLAEISTAVEPTRVGWNKVFEAPDDLIEPLYIWPGGTTFPAVSLLTPSMPLGSPNPLSGIWQNPRAPRADQRVPFAVEAASADDTKVILCDYDSPVLVYTARLKDVAQFSPLFTDALAWHLAAIFAMPLSIKMEVQNLCEKRAEEAVERAIARHFQGQQEDLSPDSEMISGRL